MLENSEIFVIGGLGFIGCHVVRSLLAQGCKVRVMSRTKVPDAQIHNMFGYQANLKIVTGDFTCKEDLLPALAGCDTCIHLATTTLPSTSNNNKIFDIQSNLAGTVQLLEAMREQNIRKIVYLSSGGTVYGNPIHVPISETHPTNPISSYGIVKLAVEKYCYLFQELYGIQSVVLRLSNPYGPGQTGNRIQGVVPVFIEKALTGKSIEIWGDGNVVRDYIYIDDVTSAINAALCYQGQETVFNIGHGTGTRLNDIVDALKVLIGQNILVEYKPGRSLDVSKNILDISKAQKCLNWSPQVDFEAGIKAVISSLADEQVAKKEFS
ncbi:NAD-dependent epimerase/dehydratase family protein [Acetobacter syzygii]|uniref:NAD-dependent epimerase/dehydratase domain-containing protein n=1 Tax=Acetobacter syzygii TaxID=146476 RepID=A0A270BL39_9PROT|nr:NAD-dependent epimerase/dehydratase family protein [Acetobacter syzygii]PAL25753.1 hypothetical protein B9K05_08395 [Acetobacter syzygii]PAL25864.1 hypothetical protein B9K04_07885 [Acetobacter syzygii]